MKHLKATVTSRLEISSHLWIVRVRPEEKISFVPGQYVTIGLPAESKLIERPYSVASSPGDPDLEFFLQVVPEGKLSPRVVHHGKPAGALHPSEPGPLPFGGRWLDGRHFKCVKRGASGRGLPAPRSWLRVKPTKSSS